MYTRSLNAPIGKKSFFLFGARQTGKSTLIREGLRKKPHLVLDFLQRDIYLKYKAEPHRLRKELQAMDLSKQVFTVFIDEIQKVPEILDEIHGLIEQYKGRAVFIMTGSSARKLKRSSANLLAGRAWQLFLHPLTHRELGSDFSLMTALSRGTLPPVIKESPADAVKSLEAYAQIYLKEEIFDEALTRNVAAFSKFLEVAADQSGKIVNYSGIARETHVSAKTVGGYYQILEDTLILRRLPPYEKSVRKRLVLHPKFYFFDVGVLRGILGTGAQEVREGTETYGTLFEHFVILEIMRLAEYANRHWRFYHWRTSGGAEVDLIIETTEGVWAIEIKTSRRVETSDLRGLRSFSECFSQARCLCVSPTDRAYQAGKFHVVPWQELFGPDYLKI